MTSGFRHWPRAQRLISAAVLALLAALSPHRAVGKSPADYVDLMLGSSNSRWMLFPGPTMPFGMVKLSPDNGTLVWLRVGYDYRFRSVAGFSHIHSWRLGGLLTMPTTGPLKVVPGPPAAPHRGYRSSFSHARKTATPGYYSVMLDDYGILAEFTATTRVGWQRYTFPEADDARILFDLEIPTEESGYDAVDAKVRKVSDTEIEGYSHQMSHGYMDYTVHFVTRFSKPFNTLGGWLTLGPERSVVRDVQELSGKGDIGAFVTYKTAENEVVQIKTGVSYVSIDQARRNLSMETDHLGWDFDPARAQARKSWNDLLGRLEVSGGTEIDHTKFYTNLYRSYCARTIFSDADGKYVDMYEKVQQLPDAESPVYGCDAFWNTFWNLNQLWTRVR